MYIMYQWWWHWAIFPAAFEHPPKREINHHLYAICFAHCVYILMDVIHIFIHVWRIHELYFVNRFKDMSIYAITCQWKCMYCENTVIKDVLESLKYIRGMTWRNCVCYCLFATRYGFLFWIYRLWCIFSNCNWTLRVFLDVFRKFHVQK